MHHLTKRFPLGHSLSDWLARRPRRAVHALNGVDLAIPRGWTLGVVGESGSGKSTLALCVSGLVEPSEGRVEVSGETLPPRLANRSAAQLRALQMVFQDPDEALNPHRTVGDALARTLRRLTGGAASQGGDSGVNHQVGDLDPTVAELLARVRLPADYAARRPGELSGGERQRVAMARAFAARPAVLLLDEPVSALDVTVQAAILDLLAEIQREQSTSYLLISHDLAAVCRLADTIAVMYLGQLMEIGPADRVLAAPHHPYTEALLAAVPSIDPDALHAPIRLPGEMPSAIDPPGGCPFHSRCPRFLGPVCAEEPPPWREEPGGHRVLCHIPLDELAIMQARSTTPNVSDDPAPDVAG